MTINTTPKPEAAASLQQHAATVPQPKAPTPGQDDLNPLTHGTASAGVHGRTMGQR